MRNLAIVSVIMLLCGDPQCLVAQEKIGLTIRFLQESVLESQAAWVHVSLVNYSSTDQVVQPHVLTDDKSRGVQFVLRDESNILVPRSAWVYSDDFGTAQPHVLAPGDSITQMFNMLEWFSTSGKKNAAVYLRTMHYLKAGSYSLHAVQFTGEDTLTSRIVRIRVLKPDGEELHAHKVLSDADREYARDRRSDATILAYENMVDSFPQSVFTPYAYDKLIWIHRWLRPKKNNQEVIKWISRMCKAFPDDLQSLYTLSGYTPFVVRNGRQDILELFSRKYPETSVGQFSKRKLQELEKRQR